MREPGRFDAYARLGAGRTIATAPRVVNELEPNDPLKLKWTGFRDSHPGPWSIHLDERSGMPTLVTGRGIRWFAPEEVAALTLEDLADAARAFLATNEGLLGTWTTWLTLDEQASAELREGYWQIVFRQQVDGVVVENARLQLRVDQGKLTMFGASNWAVPTVSGTPTIDAARAREILDAYVDGRTRDLADATEPELVLIALDAAESPDGPRAWNGQRGAGLSHTLVWRLRLRDGDGPAEWTGEIDAHDGRLRAFYDGAHYAAVRGGVFPEHPEGDCVTGGCEIDDFPLPFVDWTEAGQTATTADAYGNFSCTDPGSTFETRLAGQYVEIDDTCGSILEVASCGDDVQLGVKEGENCATAEGSSPGNTAAARTSYYHVNRVAEVARYYNPGNAWLDSRVTVNSNWIGACNASYGGGQIYVYREGSGCSNSGEIQGIIVHEWGHGYDKNDGGDWDNTSEAYGDLVSLLASRQSCFGKSLAPAGSTCSGYGDTCLTCTGFRDHDYTARQANTPATPQVFVQNNCSEGAGPCGRSVHCETYPIVEAMFELATVDLPAAGMDQATAWQLVERLWYSSRVGSGGDIYNCAFPDSDSCAVGSWYQQLRAADDDDADLSNGTPHAAELYAAFARHNIACGGVGDAENQSSTVCSALATPALTVTAVQGATEVSWSAVGGAAEYIVYRGDLGCLRQQVAVATLAAGTTSWLDTVGDPGVTRYYRVEAVGSNPACRSAVSSCESTPNGPRLQKNAHRLIEAGPNVNANGRLDPGETVQLPVTLFNAGTEDGFNVHGRLRTADATQGRVVEPVATWGSIAVDTELESPAPHFELTLFDDGIECGETVSLQLEMNADGAAARSKGFSFVLGEKEREYAAAANEELSRFDTNPVLSTFEMTDDTVIGDLDISVNIDHTRPFDLIVELTSPEGTTVRLHDLSPGSGGVITRYDLLTTPDGPGAMTDFEGESPLGTWTLSAQNTVFGGGSGSIGAWTLHVTSAGAFDCEVFACAESPPSVAPDGLLVNKSVDGADGSLDLELSWNPVAGAAGYHVLQAAMPGFDGWVDLTGRTAGAAMLLVDNGVATTPALTFFQVRAVNSCNEESP